MIETEEPISLEDMEKVLKYLPEPTLLEVSLYNFDFSDVHKQASKIAERLELKLDKIGYIKIETNVLEPSKEKILRIYRSNVERKSELRSRTEEQYDPKFINFKRAEWFLGSLEIKLDPFSVLVKCVNEVPDYIEKMKEELKDTFVDYKIEQRRTFY